MRAYFKNMLLAYSGACDGLIYYYNRRLGRVLVRPYVKPRPTENNRRFGRTAANLKALAPSTAPPGLSPFRLAHNLQTP